MQSHLLLLKEKYGLVHVPSLHKAQRWKKAAQSLIHSGYPPEQAGMEAARKVFSYEYKEYAAYGGESAQALLSYF